MSVCIGASATGARAYTATASQGLLFMIEAVYNASGLGLPIVMTLANRAIGAPINIWNDHSDAMAVRDAGWIQLFAETNQEAVDLHVQAFRLAEELSMPVMVCMDGFILTHAFEAVEIPTQQQVDAFVPRVRAEAGPRPPRACVHRRHGRSRGVRGGPVPRARQTASGPRPHPRDRGRVRGNVRAALGGSRELVPERGRRDDRGGSGLGARDHQGRCRLPCASRGCASGWSGSVRSVPSRPRRCGPRWAVPGGWWSSRRRLPRVPEALSPPTCRWRRQGFPLQTHAVIAGLGGRPITRASLTELFQLAESDGLEALTFLDLDRTLSSVSWRGWRVAVARAPRPRTCCAMSASCRLGSREERAMPHPTGEVLPNGKLCGRQPIAASGAAFGASRRPADQLAQFGPPGMPGMWRGARSPVCSRCRHAGDQRTT